MRSTAAHSTLNINEINSSDIFFDKDTTQELQKFSLRNSMKMKMYG